MIYPEEANVNEVDQYAVGRVIWQKHRNIAHAARYICSVNTPPAVASATEAGIAMARRLAPELTFDPDTQHLVMKDGLVTTLVAHETGLAAKGVGQNCCSHTFHDEHWIPYVERALTFYLYYKHFPQRFNERPDYHIPNIADPLGLVPTFPNPMVDIWR